MIITIWVILGVLVTVQLNLLLLMKLIRSIYSLQMDLMSLTEAIQNDIRRS